MKQKKIASVILIMIMVLSCAGCGKTYTCDGCGENIHEAYYVPGEDDTYLCRKCAMDYFAPFPYSQYKVED